MHTYNTVLHNRWMESISRLDIHICIRAFYKKDYILHWLGCSPVLSTLHLAMVQLHGLGLSLLKLPSLPGFVVELRLQVNLNVTLVRFASFTQYC